MALTKPLKLKREVIQLARVGAQIDPYLQVLVDHRIAHLEQYFEYQLPESLSSKATIGALVEIEFGNTLTLGVIVDRYMNSKVSGPIKSINKVLSTHPYILPDQLSNIQRVAKLYGVNPWEFIRTCVPPFSKAGERVGNLASVASSSSFSASMQLPAVLMDSLQNEVHLVCAIEIPVSRKYWEIVAASALARMTVGPVLLLVPNEREILLLQKVLHELGNEPIVISSAQGKSERYRNYLAARTQTSNIVIATRSAALFSLTPNSTIILLDDVDESHYERQSPTWNTRDLVTLREDALSVIYISTSMSLEIAHRVLEGQLKLFQFPASKPFKVQSASGSEDSGYFELIRTGLAKGSVLLSVGTLGYVTAFSCQKCRNIALCSCGGRLYFPKRGSHPLCSICQNEYLEWKCSWCQGSQPRALGRGVARQAEEFGRSFPNYPVITSTAAAPIPILPSGSHLVISTPGVEPRGEYAAQIFLDLEHKLLRTTLRASEELRFQIRRTLSMLAPGGLTYFSLLPSDAFLQSILRGNALLTAAREIEERDAVHLPPTFLTVLIMSENIEGVVQVIQEKIQCEILGPFLRGERKAILIKAPKESRGEITELLLQINKVQSMRKLPLMTYQINPYSLN